MASPTRLLRALCATPSKSGFAPCLQRYLQTRSCHWQEAVATKDVASEIQIPKRIRREPTAVLRALGNTVRRDPTALPYMYHDDPFLLPKNAGEKKRYSLAAESGRKAAQYVIKRWPEHFLALQRDAPRVEAFYPQPKEYLFDDPSEESVLERVERADMKGALEMFYRLLETGGEVSIETSNALLDLLCYHGYSPETTPIGEGKAQEAEKEGSSEAVEVAEQPEAEDRGGRGRRRKRAGREARWKENNEMEKLFGAMPERDPRSYRSMIRGAIKHGAPTRAFVLYNEMQERGVQADVQAYNALIRGAVFIREDYTERWNVIYQLLKQMQLEGVSPDLHTFNTLLDALRIMGVVGRKKALQTVSEMRAVGVEPSLGTYNLLLMIFYKESLPPSDIIHEILDSIEGTSFTLRHEQDVHFFKNAMSIDLELAYKLDLLLNTDENYKMAGDYFSQNIYYSKFFNLICLLDGVDAMLDYYDNLVPAALIPSSQVYIEMLRSMETAGAYHKLGLIWRDVRHFGLHYVQTLLETFLSVMAQGTHVNDKVLSDFLDIALEIKALMKSSESRRDPLVWRTTSLTHLAMICLRAKNVDRAREAFDLFTQEKKAPSNILLEDYLDACIASRSSQQSIECLQLVASISSTLVLPFADRIKGEFELHPRQRKLIETILCEEDVAQEGSHQMA